MADHGTSTSWQPLRSIPCIPANAVYVVYGEMQLVVSCMRRSAQRAQPHDHTDPLLLAFGALKRRLAKTATLAKLTVNDFVSPFLEVVRSEAVAGPVTAVALDSIGKFLAYGVVAPSSPGLVAGVENIADAVTHARFVGTDLASDEVVLTKILAVLRRLLLSDVGNQLSNELVCELMQSSFRISCEPRLSELLRRTAEQVLVDMVQKLFARLRELDKHPQSQSGSATTLLTTLTAHGEGETLRPSLNQEQDKEPSLVSSVSTEGEGSISPTVKQLLVVSSAATEEAAVGTATQPTERFNSRGVRFEPQGNHHGGMPYGVPCVRELLRFLVSLITAKDNLESMIQMGLSLLTVAIETGGARLHEFPSLLEIAEDSLLRNLFQLIKHDNLTLFAATLRVVFLIFQCQLPRLKFQVKHFLTLVMRMDFPSYEHKEGALDTLLQLFCLPAFVNDLYINFDAHLYGGPLLAEVVHFLAQNAYSDSGEVPVMTVHLTALGALLAAVNQLRTPVPAGLLSGRALPSAADIVDIKRKKAVLAIGAEQFNEKAKKGIRYLQENGLLSANPSPTELACFFRSDFRLSKTEIGDYIGKKENEKVLEAFVRSFEFSDKPLDEALRQLLASFRLPGESAIIERILEYFSDVWLSTYQGNSIITNTDAVFILSYAIILLNVDQHNPKNKKPMTLKEFIRNQRGLNSGQDFPPDFLEAIYVAIKSREIVMPEEHEGELKEDFEWKLMLSQARDAGVQFLSTCGHHTYDADIFALLWKPTVTALSYILDHVASDNAIVESTMEGFGTCAQMAAQLGNVEVFDHIVISLCQRTLLAGRAPGATDLNLNNDELPVGLQFGRSFKAQSVATMALHLTKEYGNFLKEGWGNVLHIIQEMYLHGLLPADMMLVADFIHGRRSLVQAAKPNVVKTDASIFSTLSSFFSDPSTPVKGRDGNQAALDAAKRCIHDCQIQYLFTDSAFLQLNSLHELCKALVFLSSVEEHLSPSQEEVRAFFLNLLCEVALANRDRIEYIFDTVAHHLTIVIAQAKQQPLLLDRALVSMLRLGIRLIYKEQISGRILEVFTSILQLPQPLPQPVLLQVAAGMGEFITLGSNVVSVLERENGWELIFNILQLVIPEAQAMQVTVRALNVLLASTDLTIKLYVPGKRVTLLFAEAWCSRAVVMPPAPTKMARAAVLSPAPMGVADAHSPGLIVGPPATTAAVVGGGVASPAAEATVSSDSVLAKTIEVPLPLAILELMSTFHKRTMGLFEGSEETELYTTHYEPLLQQMSAFCLDQQKGIRQMALTVLQSSLLLRDLDTGLGPEDWKACLERVIFPLLGSLLEPPEGLSDLEETRLRCSALLCKVFLQHLTALVQLSDFAHIWLRVLDLMEKFLRCSELLAEAVPESLKNCLLVMSTAGIFQPAGSPDLWKLTWSRLSTFLPGLQHELFPEPVSDTVAVRATSTDNESEASRISVSPANLSSPLAMSLSTTSLDAPVPVVDQSGEGEVDDEDMPVIVEHPVSTSTEPGADGESAELHPHAIIV